MIRNARLARLTRRRVLKGILNGAAVTRRLALARLHAARQRPGTGLGSAVAAAFRHLVLGTGRQYQRVRAEEDGRGVRPARRAAAARARQAARQRLHELQCLPRLGAEPLPLHRLDHLPQRHRADRERGQARRDHRRHDRTHDRPQLALSGGDGDRERRHAHELQLRERQLGQCRGALAAQPVHANLRSRLPGSECRRIHAEPPRHGAQERAVGRARPDARDVEGGGRRGPCAARPVLHRAARPRAAVRPAAHQARAHRGLPPGGDRRGRIRARASMPTSSRSGIAS